MASHVQHIRSAFIRRRSIEAQSFRDEIAQVASLVILVISVAMYLAPNGEDLDYHFVEENGLITVLSSFALAVAAALSFASKVIDENRGNRGNWFWLVLTAGFTYLSIDEVFQIHEKIGWFLGDRFDSGPFRNWNDVVVILYGVMAIPVVWILLPKLLEVKVLPELFAVAFLFYGITTLIDSVVQDATTMSNIFEESFKLMCNAFLALGTYTGFVFTLRKNRRKEPAV